MSQSNGVSLRNDVQFSFLLSIIINNNSGFLPCLPKGKSMKIEPGEVTSPPHSSKMKDDGLKRDRESQEMNDSDEEEEEEEGDLLEEEEVRI